MGIMMKLSGTAKTANKRKTLFPRELRRIKEKRSAARRKLEKESRRRNFGLSKRSKRR